MGVASFTAFSAALFRTLKPSSINFFKPISFNVLSTFFSLSGNVIFTNPFLKNPFF